MAHLGTRSLLLAVDGTDYTADVAKAVITSKATGLRLRGRLIGEREYSLQITTPQDAAAGTLWGLAWTRSGETADFYLAPYGNEIATESQPHYAGTVIVDEPDGDFLGGSADPSRGRVMTVDMSWPTVGKPEQITSGSYPALLPAGW